MTITIIHAVVVIVQKITLRNWRKWQHNKTITDRHWGFVF